MAFSPETRPANENEQQGNARETCKEQPPHVVTSRRILACLASASDDTAGWRNSGALMGSTEWRGHTNKRQTGGMATFGNLETEVEPLATLMREHTEIHTLVTQAQELLEAALGAGDASDPAGRALAAVRDLDAYMAESLVIHIAKEEDVLFPALRGFAADIDQVVEEMVEQHDEVRNRQAIIARAVAAMSHTHDEVDAARTGLSGAVARASLSLTQESLEELLDGVRRLDWMLQGHFGDEEDDLFVPALELLTAETFAEMAAKAERIELGLD